MKMKKKEDDKTDYRPFIVALIIMNLVNFGLFISSGVVGLLTDIVFKLFYVQVATTFLGVSLSITETLLMVCVIAKFAQDDRRDIQQGTNEVKRMLQTRLYEFNAKSGVLFFIGMLCLNGSLALVLWCFTSIISYPTFGQRSYFHFRAIDIIIGYIAPVLIMVGLVIILKVMQLVTKYKFKPESIFASILVFVDYDTFNGNPWETRTELIDGEEQVFTRGFGGWSIAGIFHYPIVETKEDMNEIREVYKRARHEEDPLIENDDDDNKAASNEKLTWTYLKQYCYRKIFGINWASLCLGTILVLNIILCLRVITDAIVIKEIDGRPLSCRDVDEDMDCFSEITRSYINCTDNNSTYNMECYRYYSPSEIDPLGALIRAIFLFITFEKFLQLLFGVMATLYHIRYSKLWGLSVFVLGIAMIALSIVSLVFYDNLKTGFVFLSVFEFFILSIDIFLAGLLLVANQGYYKTAEGNLEMYVKRSHDKTTIEPTDGVVEETMLT